MAKNVGRGKKTKSSRFSLTGYTRQRRRDRDTLDRRPSFTPSKNSAIPYPSPRVRLLELVKKKEEQANLTTYPHWVDLDRGLQSVKLDDEDAELCLQIVSFPRAKALVVGGILHLLLIAINKEAHYG